MAQARTRRVRGIVLDRTKLGEQDLIITILGESGEELRAVAKGARKPGGRLSSRVELFCQDDLLLARGRTLDIVSEATTIDAHAGIRGDLARLAAASAVSEVARLTCFPESADPYLYPICARALTACEQAGDQAQLDAVVAAYVIKVLAHGGWRPQLGTCVHCGDHAVSMVSVSAGGALCSSCAKSVGDAEDVGRAYVTWLGRLVTSTFDELLGMAPDAMCAAWLVAFGHRWAAAQLECRIRSLEFYLSV